MLIKDWMAKNPRHDYRRHSMIKPFNIMKERQFRRLAVR